MEMEWWELGTRLAAGLGRAVDDHPSLTLIIADQRAPSRYVQFLGGSAAGGVWVQLAGNHERRPRQHRMSFRQGYKLSKRGWKQADWTGPNLTFGGVHGKEALRSLADEVVAAMRIIEMDDPGQLTYAAATAPDGQPVAVAELDTYGLPRLGLQQMVDLVDGAAGGRP